LVGLGLGDLGNLGISNKQPQRQRSQSRPKSQHQNNAGPSNQRPPHGAIPAPPMHGGPMHPPPTQPPPMHQQNMHQQSMQQQIPVPPLQPIFQPPYPVSARQSSQNMSGNPFAPFPNVAAPPDLNMPPMDGVEFIHPHMGQQQQHRSISRPRARSFGHGDQQRAQSARRPSMEARRHSSRPGNGFDDMQRQMQNFSFEDDSYDSMRDDESVFSLPPSETYSLTPPSSPRSHFSDRQHQALQRRRSTSYRQSRYRPKHRSSSFQDAVVVPYRSRDDQLVRREPLRRAVTYDDYPDGRAMDKRYIRAPDPPRLHQRSVTMYPGDGYPHHDRALDFEERERERELRRRERELQYSREYSRPLDDYDIRYREGGRRRERVKVYYQ
jgi:hypothetical protein